MTPIEAVAAVARAASAVRVPGTRTTYSQRERALVAVLLAIARSEGYGAAADLFDAESDGVVRAAREDAGSGADLPPNEGPGRRSAAPQSNDEEGR